MVTLPLTALAAGIGGVSVWAVVRRVRSGGTGGQAVGWALAVVGGLSFAGLCLVVALAGAGSLRIFGVAHFLYLAITVSVPMAGAAAAWASWRTGAGVVPKALSVLALLPAPFGLYATHVEPLWLRVDRVTVALDPARGGDDPITIGVLADLQTNRVGDHERQAVDELIAAEPDVILIPGDLFHGNDDEYERELGAMRELLGRLDAPHGVYFSQGDADPPEWVEKMFEGTDISVMDRGIAALRIGDRQVRIGGHSLHPSAHDAAVVRSALRQTLDPEVITILFAHRPDTVLFLEPDSRVDLTIAGHTHGGQIVLPGFGPLVTLSEVPRDVARGGLHEVDGNAIYVSTGVGIERGDAPQVRLFNRPSVAILTLE